MEEQQLGHDSQALVGLGLENSCARAQRAGIDLGVRVEDEDPVAPALVQASVDAGGEPEVAAQFDGQSAVELGRDAPGGG